MIEEQERLRELLLRELPLLLERDVGIREQVLHIVQPYFAPVKETKSRFDEMLGEIRQMREESERKWEQNQQELQRMREESEHKWEQNQQELQRMREESERKWEQNQQELQRMREESERKWQASQEESNRKWAEQDKKWEEQNRKWWENQQELQRMREESERKWQASQEESNRKWAEQNEKWEEQNRKWWENQQALRELNRKHESTIGALGARWGLSSEESFRNGLSAILSELNDIEVLHVVDYDEKGEVFGYPEQIELDVVVKNGMLILCEIKSSLTKAELYAFERKTQFYARHHGREVTRKMVISPMIDKRARPPAERLGIHLYSYAEDVEPDMLQPPDNSDPEA